MAILGLGDAGKDAAKKSKKKSSKKADANNSSQADEAKALLEKMEAKEDSEGCVFC